MHIVYHLANKQICTYSITIRRLNVFHEVKSSRIVGEAVDDVTSSNRTEKQNCVIRREHPRYAHILHA